MSVDNMNALSACVATMAPMQNKAVASTPSDPIAFSRLMTPDVVSENLHSYLDPLTINPHADAVNNLNQFSIDMNMPWGTFLESFTETKKVDVSGGGAEVFVKKSSEEEITVPGFLKNVQANILLDNSVHTDTQIMEAKTPGNHNKTPTLKKPQQPQVMNYIAPNRITPFVSVDQEKPSVEDKRQDLPQDLTQPIEENFSTQNLNNPIAVCSEFSPVEKGLEGFHEKTFKNNNLNIQMAVFSSSISQQLDKAIEPISTENFSDTFLQSKMLPLSSPVFNLDPQKILLPSEVSMTHQSNINGRIQLNSAGPVIIESIAAPIVFSKPTIELNYHAEASSAGIYMPSITKNLAVNEGGVKVENTSEMMEEIVDKSMEISSEISTENNPDSAIRALDHAKPFEKTMAATLTETAETVVNHETIMKNIREQVPVQMPRQIVSGETHLKIQLHPEELGHVDIRVDIAKNGTAKIMMVAENAIVRDVLSQYRQDITQIFEQPGLSLDAGSLNFSMRQDQQSGEKDQQSSRFSFETESSFESTELNTQHLQRNSSSHAVGMIDINA